MRSDETEARDSEDQEVCFLEWIPQMGHTKCRHQSDAPPGTPGATRRARCRDYLSIPTIPWNPWRGDRQKNHQEAHKTNEERKERQDQGVLGDDKIVLLHVEQGQDTIPEQFFGYL